MKTAVITITSTKLDARVIFVTWRVAHSICAYSHIITCTANFKQAKNMIVKLICINSKIGNGEPYKSGYGKLSFYMYFAINRGKICVDN